MKNTLLRLLPAAALITLAACGSKSEKSERQAPATAIAVKTLTLSPTEVPNVFSAPGTVAAKTSSTLASQILAPILFT